MAAIDKIYGTNEEYDIFYLWAATNNRELLKYFYPREGYENAKYDRPITNFPQELDEWLIQNCPIQFVRENLQFQYNLDENMKPKKMRK